MTMTLDCVESYEHNGATITIHYDPDPLNPRKDYDHCSTFYASHRRYDLGDDFEPDYDSSECTSWDDELALIHRTYHPRVILPVFLYDHSGLTVNTTGFPCPWDSGQIGFIWQTAEQIRDQFLVKRITKDVEARALDGLRAEVSEYGDYLTGNCYGFVVERDGEEVDSCWGFLGDLKYVKAEAEAAATFSLDEARAVTRWKIACPDGAEHGLRVFNTEAEAAEYAAGRFSCSGGHTVVPTTERVASCGIKWVDGEPTPDPHALCLSHPGLSFFSDESVNWPRLCAVPGCGKSEEPHLRITSVARGAKVIDHDFVPRLPLHFDTYYCGCRGWD